MSALDKPLSPDCGRLLWAASNLVVCCPLSIFYCLYNRMITSTHFYNAMCHLISGNFDRATRMLEIKANGSLEDRRYSSLGSRPGEEALIERIADAMQDCSNVGTDGKFSPSSSPRRKTLGPKRGKNDNRFLKQHFN